MVLVLVMASKAIHGSGSYERTLGPEEGCTCIYSLKRNSVLCLSICMSTNEIFDHQVPMSDAEGETGRQNRPFPRELVIRKYLAESSPTAELSATTFQKSSSEVIYWSKTG